MKLYSVSDKYINHLRKIFPRIYSNKEDTRVHTRKYVGVVIEISDHKYYIPLSSPKKHDYITINGANEIRNDSLIVIRITAVEGGTKVLKGTLQIGTMIPVPDSEIELYDVEGETDESYKSMINSEIIYIRKNKDKILNTAKVLYSKKKSGDSTNKVVANCLDFIAVEEECDKWIGMNKEE